MIEDVMEFVVSEGILLFSFEESEHGRFLIITLIKEDGEEHEITIDEDQAYEVLAVLLDFLTEG